MIGKSDSVFEHLITDQKHVESQSFAYYLAIFQFYAYFLSKYEHLCAVMITYAQQYEQNKTSDVEI